MSGALLLVSMISTVAMAAPCPTKVADRTVPCTPSAHEMALIMGDIHKGLDAEDEFQTAKKSEAELRAAMHNGGTYQVLEKWKTALETMNDRAAIRDQLFNEAIELTNQYYGLKQSGSGIVRDGPGAGLRANWKPQFVARDENENKSIVRPVDVAERTPSFWKAEVGGDVRARTWGDGRVDVYIETFRAVATVDTPWGLALPLYHESIHFDDMTTRGRGNPNTAEFHAYAESLKLAEVLGLPESAKKNLKRRRDETRALSLAETVALGLVRRYARGIFEDIAEESARDEWYGRQLERDSIGRDREALAERLVREKNDRAQSTIHDWAQRACSDELWYESYDWSRVPAAYDDLAVLGAPIEFPGLPYANRPEDACSRFVEDQVLIRRAHKEGTPEWPWIWRLAHNTRERARAEEDRLARGTLQGWADSACGGLSSWQGTYGLEKLQRMYRGIIPSTWDGRRAVAMGDPRACSYYVIDAMLAQKRHGGAEPDWQRFSDLAWIAFTEHRPSLLPPAIAGPTPAPPPVTTPQPRPAPSSDPGPSRTDPQPPPVPHCHNQPWCRDNLPKNQ